MICNKCGKGIENDSRFCQFCGTQVLLENFTENNSKKRIFVEINYMHLIMLISQIIGIFTTSNWVIGLCIGAYFADLQYLKAIGVKGLWKIWGLILTPVYFFIRAKKTNQKPIVATISIILVAVSIFSTFISNDFFVKENTDEAYINSAITLVNKTLKNPNSVIYNETYIYEKDDYGRAIIYLDYSAENSFGGFVREKKYVFINELNNDGTFNYHPTYYYCPAGNDIASTTLFDLTKTKNNFGNPKNKY